MTVFWVLLGIAVLCGVAVVAAGRGDGLDPTYPDRPDLTLPADRLVLREDVDRLRFSVGVRGYRMDEVDDVLDRLAADIAARDQHIRELEGARPPEYPSQTWASPDGTDTHEGEPAAFLPPQETEEDLPTSRTLLVPLDQFVPEPPPHEPAKDE